MNQHNSDGTDPGLPVVSFNKPWRFLQDMVCAFVYICGPVVLGVLLFVILALSTGLFDLFF